MKWAAWEIITDKVEWAAWVEEWEVVCDESNIKLG